MAFNAKNLTYHIQEPVFLQRLRHEHQGSSPGTSRTSVTGHRNHLKQSAEDDQPTYVLEGDGEIVSQAKVDQMVSKSDIETQNAVHSATTGSKGVSGETQAPQGSHLTTYCDATKSPTTTIGARTRKRPIKAVDESAGGSCDQNSEKNPQTSIKTKRSKKVKLSFEDND